MNSSIYGPPSPLVEKKLESDSSGCTSIDIFHRFDSSLLNVLKSFNIHLQGFKTFPSPQHLRAQWNNIVNIHV